MAMNTTKLIDHWNMDGAADLKGCFGSVPEVHGPSRRDEPALPGAAGEVLLKRAGAEEWQPLRVDTESA